MCIRDSVAPEDGVAGVPEEALVGPRGGDAQVARTRSSVQLSLVPGSMLRWVQTVSRPSMSIRLVSTTLEMALTAVQWKGSRLVS